MSTLTLIKHIRRRSRPLGIGTAADYLRELEVCLGGRCPSGLLDGVSRRQWRAWLKAARRKLVYHHEDMRPLTEGVRQQASGVRPPIPDACSLTPKDGGPALASSLVPPYELPPHTLATFPAVITTTRQDLDGDVLETAGAELDPRAPLLWQHLPDLPIGRLLDVGERTAQRLTGTFSIADTALGQDAALLAEHGALRISHGFLPTKWEPLDGDDAGRNGTESVPYSGYHILQFKILEVSLVSVPSNPDAVIEAFSRAKLAHPLVKAWAGTRFENRPVVVSGADLQARVGWDQRACERRPTEEKALGDRRWALGQASTAEVPTPNAQSLTPSDPAQPTNDPVIPEIQSMNPTLHQKAGRALNAVNERRVRAARFHFKAIEHHDDSRGAVAELARKATLPLDDMLDQLDGDGSKPKSGRVVSQENADRLAEAIQHGGAIAQHEQATAEVSALASGAVKHLNAVLDSNLQDDDGGGMSYHDGNPTGCAASAVAGAELGRVGTDNDQTALPAKRCPGAPVQPGHRVAATSVSIETVNAPRSAPATYQDQSPKTQDLFIQGTPTMQTETQLQPAQVFSTAAAAAPRVKRASEQYDSTKRRLIWPNDKKSALHIGRLAGHDVTFENRPAYESSQLEKAMAGAWLKHKLASQLGTAHLHSDHDRDLYQELVERGEWVGEVRDGNGTHYYREPGRLSPLHQKTLLADSTSGGQYAVPYFFDVDLVTFPLLYGELFPLVDLRELATSNQVKGATLANMTISAGPAEGDTPGITLATTSSLVGQLTTNIYNATGAITIGRDFLADSPVDLQADIISLYQRALLQWLDKEIANGDGTTGPLGLFNTANVLTATSKNSTAGPMTVSDIEGMVKTLPKQYRNKQENVVWVASDGLYFRIRGISVSGTDQRRIFGYDYEQYMLASHPFKIENDVAGSDLAFVNMSKYRMWRRKGMEIQVSDEGKTLMLANELLIVARSRWGGQLVDPNAMVEMTNASLH
ncbi:MAG TPA: phage major capsid protein [Pirellulales bacterium]|nr:phage major capsid protein [Pirellulales bacterium]